jgi:hypothetical protein
MTLFKVSTADKYSVSAVQKTVQDERGLYPPRAHYPDHPDIRRILHPAHTSSVGCSVTAPVAEEAKYPGLVFHEIAPSSFSADAPNASICALICSSVNLPIEIAFVGQ